ncbi:hypothetical protein [Mesorhizobium sp. ES1-3]|uniref:hypothetical protein n=1 Tax=Mesorhizobium sp. ES1-3 TaxID=2876628 RepID=UPI001CC93057|nr:hypothetical protein [Mesorhizobium sp. ES1-3]MBZ9668707.1 hypothetical protein [Mesorhizobium sp. ES1-3]
MAGDPVAPLDTLKAVIGLLLPARLRNPVRRRIMVIHERELREADLETAVAALSDPRADRLVDCEVVVALLGAIDRLNRGDAHVDTLLARVVVHVERRWDDLAGC